MKKNLGAIDRIMRFIVVAVISYLFFTNVITGTLGTVLLIVAGIFVLTSLVSPCPLYSFFGKNTCEAEIKGS